MKKKLLILLIFIFTLPQLQAQVREIWMFGPMMHVNFGGEKTRVSWALEFSYWNYQRFPYSFDFAFEFERGKMRLYSEAQTGFGFGGIAAGPVFEFGSNVNKPRIGFQGSIWGNYFLGFDIRTRRIGGETFFSPGTYLKYPTAVFTKEFHEGNSSSDWDWD